jgi:hypothetical protein
LIFQIAVSAKLHLASAGFTNFSSTCQNFILQKPASQAACHSATYSVFCALDADHGQIAAVRCAAVDRRWREWSGAFDSAVIYWGA